MVERLRLAIRFTRLISRGISRPSSWGAMLLMACFLTPGISQTRSDQAAQESQVQVYWDDEQQTSDEYSLEDTLGYDEYYDEGEYVEEDSAYYEDSVSYDEDSAYVDADELTDEELADYAQSQGFTLSLTSASPGFVNHALMTYNSNIDYRVGIEFPVLLEIGRIRFRLGIEVGSYDFKNYLPAGGRFNGMIYNGFLAFPAGPGQVKLGGGIAGNRFDFIAETTYGFALGNSLDIRLGIRSTTVSDVSDSKEHSLGTVSWMDGLLTLGISL